MRLARNPFWIHHIFGRRINIDMTAPLRKSLTFSLFTCLLPLAAVAEATEVVGETTHWVAGFNVGSYDTSSDYRFTHATSVDGETSAPTIAEGALDLPSDTGYSLAAGIENGTMRIMLELYHSEVSVNASPLVFDGGASELETRSLYYSGYWLPDIYEGIKGILGAGVGYSRHYLSGNLVDELKDGGWSLKASAGLEYAINGRLSVYGLAEKMFHKDLEEQWSAETNNFTFAFSGHEQTRLAIGLNYRF